MTRRDRMLLTVAALTAVAVAFLPRPVAAHTGFESSDPPDGATVEAPVDTVTLTFTGEAVVAGEGFLVLDPQRGERTPTTVTTPAEGVFELRFDPPVSPGRAGMRWTVKAPDGHPISGTVQFTVTGGTEPSPRSPDGDGDTGGGTAASSGPGQAQDLDGFLAGEETSGSGRLLGDIGRALAMAGTMVAIGFLVFALTVMRGTRSELRTILAWVRRGGLAVLAGTALDAAGQVAQQAGGDALALVDPAAYSDALSGMPGWALLLRIAGAGIVAAGARLRMVHAHTARDVVRSVSATIPVGAGSLRVADQPRDQWHERAVAWDLDRSGTFAVVGLGLLVLSHTLDGHTATEGHRLLTSAAAAAHVIAAAVWTGGVAALALVVGGRARRGQRTRALVLVTRYSVVATLALVAVAVFGAYLAVAVLDAPSELWTTGWGRLLLAKTAAVAVAAGLGAHTHYVVVPALETTGDHPETVRRLRSTLVAEVLTLAGVIALTALLVQASSTA